MALQTNVGGTDRIARGLLGLALLAGAVGAMLADMRSLGVAVAVAGVIVLFTAVTRFCGVYTLLGVDTCSRE